MRHFLLAAVYALCVAVFFGGMLRQDWRPALKLGATIFGVMLGSVFVLGWLMYLLAP